MRPLVWFRSDLRTRDNTALHAAAAQATRGVIGVFLISPGEWTAHDVAPARLDLIFRTLAVLSRDLARLNIPLRIARAHKPGDIPATLLALAREHACDGVWFNREYELNEHRRDQAVLAAFRGAGLQAHAFDDQVYVPPGRIRTGEGRIYTVFTPFRRALYAALREQGPPTPLGLPRRQPEPAAPPSDIPPMEPGWTSQVPSSLWPAGERHAADRLAGFIESGIRSYRDRRDLPADDGTSTLSPYLTIGAVSCRQCLAAAIAANPAPGGAGPLESGAPGPATWISELAWREFYIHILAGFPRVCMGRAFLPATERLAWSPRDDHFDAWAAGRTGVPIVDAGMRQLAATGWMHNRVRMITAMFLAKNLFLDWRRGERWFMRHLVDGFLASNNGGWQWSASTGTDAAPYFRIMNPVSQSEKFDARGEYLRRWVPELAPLDSDAIHDPPALRRAALGYPAPLVDLKASRQAAIDAFRALT